MRNMRQNSRLARRAMLCTLLSLPLTLAPGFAFSRSAVGFQSRQFAITIPIHISAATESQSVCITVEAASVSETGGTVVVGCDRPDLLSPPGGQWPFVLNLAAGQTSASFRARARNVAGAASVGACELGADATDPRNWRVVTQAVTSDSLE